MSIYYYYDDGFKKEIKRIGRRKFCGLPIRHIKNMFIHTNDNAEISAPNKRIYYRLINYYSNSANIRKRNFYKQYSTIKKLLLFLCYVIFIILIHKSSIFLPYT